MAVFVVLAGALAAVALGAALVVGLRLWRVVKGLRAAAAAAGERLSPLVAEISAGAEVLRRRTEFPAGGQAAATTLAAPTASETEPPCRTSAHRS